MDGDANANTNQLILRSGKIQTYLQKRAQLEQQRKRIQDEEAELNADLLNNLQKEAENGRAAEKMLTELQARMQANGHIPLPNSAPQTSQISQQISQTQQNPTYFHPATAAFPSPYQQNAQHAYSIPMGGQHQAYNITASSSSRPSTTSMMHSAGSSGQDKETQGPRNLNQNPFYSTSTSQQAQQMQQLQQFQLQQQQQLAFQQHEQQLSKLHYMAQSARSSTASYNGLSHSVAGGQSQAQLPLLSNPHLVSMSADGRANYQQGNYIFSVGQKSSTLEGALGPTPASNSPAASPVVQVVSTNQVRATVTSKTLSVPEEVTSALPQQVTREASSQQQSSQRTSSHLAGLTQLDRNRSQANTASLQTRHILNANDAAHMAVMQNRHKNASLKVSLPPSGAGKASQSTSADSRAQSSSTSIPITNQPQSVQSQKNRSMPELSIAGSSSTNQSSNPGTQSGFPSTSFTTFPLSGPVTYSGVMSCTEASFVQPSYHIIPPRTGDANRLEQGAFITHIPTTPEKQSTSTARVLTPSSANKRSLAKDIIFALGGERRKRRAHDESDLDSGSETGIRESKRSRLSEDPVPVGIEVGLVADEFSDVPQRLTPTIEEVPDDTVASIAEVKDADDHSAAILNPTATMAVPIPSRDSSAVEDLLGNMDEQNVMPQDLFLGGDDVGPVRTAEDIAQEVTLQDLEVESDEGIVGQVVVHNAIDSMHFAKRSNSPVLNPEPLFLPSPATESFSFRDVSEEVDAKPVGQRGSKPRDVKAGSIKRTNGPTPGLRVYVDVPPLPLWLKRARFKERGKLQPKNESDSPVRVHSEEERAAKQDEIQLSSNQLRLRRCLWKGCAHISSSAKKLSTHVAQHDYRHLNDSEIVRFPCLWDGCTRRFANSSALYKHLRRHAVRPLFCNFEHCEESFQKPDDLHQHHGRRHCLESESLKRAADEFRRVPNCEDLPTLPPALSAYRILSPPVVPFKLTAERHKEVGPWVLKRIFGPVNLGTPRPNARYPVRSQHQRLAAAPRKYDEYDFLSTSPAKPVADLHSDLATGLVMEGVSMIAEAGPPKGAFEEYLMSSIPTAEERTRLANAAEEDEIELVLPDALNLTASVKGEHDVGGDADSLENVEQLV